MSEEKIIKHSENAVHILKDTGKSWEKKVWEVAGEVIIIVFAVSLTLMLHNWNDSAHERKIEREFLAGIKDDLENGAKSLEAGVNQFQHTVDYYDTVWSQMAAGKINRAYIDTNSGNLRNTNYFRFDNGRFEGFKFSGYLRLIENKLLLKHLMSLYTVDIPFQEDADMNIFHMRERDYNTYIGTRDVTDMNHPGAIFASRLVNDPAFKYQIGQYVWIFAERKAQKLWLARDMRKMADEIGKELNP